MSYVFCCATQIRQAFLSRGRIACGQPDVGRPGLKAHFDLQVVAWLISRLRRLRLGGRTILMRYIYLAIAIILSLILGAFVAQNLDMVTLRLLGFSISLPMSGLAVIIYVLGAFTGSGLYAVIRHSYSRARRHPHGAST